MPKICGEIKKNRMGNDKLEGGNVKNRWGMDEKQDGKWQNRGIFFCSRLSSFYRQFPNVFT